MTVTLSGLQAFAIVALLGASSGAIGCVMSRRRVHQSSDAYVAGVRAGMKLACKHARRAVLLGIDTNKALDIIERNAR